MLNESYSIQAGEVIAVLESSFKKSQMKVVSSRTLCIHIGLVILPTERRMCFSGDNLLSSRHYKNLDVRQPSPL